MIRHTRDLGTTAAVFAVAVVLNYPWEMAQSVLFAPMGSFAQSSWRCFVASLGDGVMILAIFIGGWLAYGRSRWFQSWSVGRIALTLIVGALIGIAVESWGLSTGRWQYNSAMPRVPGLGLALVPLLQMPMLAPLTLWVTDRWLDRRLRERF